MIFLGFRVPEGPFEKECSSKGVLEQRSARVLGAAGALVPHRVLAVLLHPWNSTWNCPPACLPWVLSGPKKGSHGGRWQRQISQLTRILL